MSKATKVPNYTTAVATAKAARAESEAERENKTDEERTLLYGQVLEALENAMKDDDVDDIAVMKDALDKLNGGDSSWPRAKRNPFMRLWDNLKS